MVYYKILFLTIFIILNSPISNSQEIKLDTTLHSNKIWKIEYKKNKMKLGLSKTYLTYSEEPRLNYEQFYINDNLYGLEIKFTWGGKISSITNYRNNIAVYNKYYYWNGETSEQIFSSIKAVLKYDKKQTLEHIEYPELKEKVEFYPNYKIKSIIVSDSSKKVLERIYYEFSENGLLQVEGTYADSFIQVLDTIITYDPETYEEIVQICFRDIPLKNGYWYYYSEKGILQEKKLYTFFTDEKSKTIKK